MTNLAVIREVDPSARIAPQAKVGPYCVVGPNATIGPNTVLSRRVTVTGNTIIGSGNHFEEGCVIGHLPQDLKYSGGKTLLTIGHNNYFGRNATVHIGTETGGYLTRIGDNNRLLEGSHVAHDCYVENNTYLGRRVLLAGHILVQTGAVLEDLAGVHHFVTIGRFARVGGKTPVRRDVPPFTEFYGSGDDQRSTPAVRGVHEAGIKAAALPADEEKELRQVFKDLFQDEEALQTKIEHLINLGVEDAAAELCAFCMQSLQGVFGRYREKFRGQLPPEAEKYLPPEQLAEARRKKA